MKFKNEDVEVFTKEIVGTNDWFDETNTVAAEPRPMRDSKSAHGKTKPYDGLPPRAFKDYHVGKVVIGVSIAISKVEWTGSVSWSGEFVRAIILHFGDETLVFDKGDPHWSDMWNVKRCSLSDVSFQNEDAPEGFAEAKVTTRIERIG